MCRDSRVQKYSFPRFCRVWHCFCQRRDGMVFKTPWNTYATVKRLDIKKKQPDQNQKLQHSLTPSILVLRALDARNPSPDMRAVALSMSVLLAKAMKREGVE
eukprot:785516-Amphidinium_carterae.1